MRLKKHLKKKSTHNIASGGTFFGAVCIIFQIFKLKRFIKPCKKARRGIPYLQHDTYESASDVVPAVL